MTEIVRVIAALAYAGAAIALLWYGREVRKLSYRVMELSLKMIPEVEDYCEKCGKITQHTYLPVPTKPLDEILECKICISREMF